jgi:hypothetical protein
MKKVGKRAHLLSTIQYDPPSTLPPPSWWKLYQT